MNLEEISKKLFSQKIIQNPNLFKIWVKISFSEKKLRYGEFIFEKSNSIYDVTKKLISGLFCRIISISPLRAITSPSPTA